MGQLYSRPSDNFIHINLDVRLCKRDYHAVIKLQPKLYINQCTQPQHAYKVCNKTAADLDLGNIQPFANSNVNNMFLVSSSNSLYTL